MIKLKKILNEKFYDDVVKKVGKDKADWIDLSNNPEKGIIEKDPELKQNMFDLVDFAYRKRLNSPHFGVKSPSDVVGSKYDYWEAIDINENPEADAVLFGKKRNGIKISGLGHDGEKISKNALTKKMAELTKIDGYWIEASGQPANILRFHGANILTDKEKVLKL